MNSHGPEPVSESGFDVAKFLSRLVQVPSCDPPGGELAVARLVHEALLGLGVESTLDEFLPGRANVLGRIRGAGRRKAFVYSAHMDTMPPGSEGWTRDPFSGAIEDGRVHGRGATDMKSALAAMVAAAGEIAKAGKSLEGDVLLAFTAGESNNLLGARRFAEQGLKGEIGAFLCGEPSNLDIIVVEMAVIWAKLIARGRMGHVSGDGGINAIEEMMKCLDRLATFPLDVPSHPLLEKPTLTVNRISGGTANNATPELCETIVDIRLPPAVGVDEILHRLQEHVGPRIGVELVECIPAIEEKPSSPFVALCFEKCRTIIGREPKIRGVSYYSDGAVLMDGVDAPFAIVGPGDLGGSATPNESVSVANLRKAVLIYRDIAEAWLR